MKYTILIASLLATLASAVPLAAGVEYQTAKPTPDDPIISIGATAGIQLNSRIKMLVQAFVPIDGSITPTEGLFASQMGSSAFIFSVTEIDPSTVSCQAFSDAKGKKPLGKPFNNVETAVFATSDVPVGAFSCKQI